MKFKKGIFSKALILGAMIMANNGHAVGPPQSHENKIGDSCLFHAVYSSFFAAGEFFAPKGNKPGKIFYYVVDFSGGGGSSGTGDLPTNAISGDINSGLNLSIHTDDIDGSVFGQTGQIDVTCTPTGDYSTKFSGSVEQHWPPLNISTKRVGTSSTTSAATDVSMFGTIRSISFGTLTDNKTVTFTY